MKREILLGVGAFLLVLGVISLSISRSTETRIEWVEPERVVTYHSDNIPHTLQNYIQGGNKYHLTISVTPPRVMIAYNERIEIRDPSNQIIFQYDDSTGNYVWDVEFQAVASGTYTIEWYGYYSSSYPQDKPADYIYIDRVLPLKELTYYPYEGILWFGVVMLLAGAGVLASGLATKREP